MSLAKNIVEEDKAEVDAKTAFDTICAMLDEKGWSYEKDEEDLRINCGYVGEDLIVDICMRINKEMRLIVLYSELPFVVAESECVPMTLAVNAVNYSLVDGSFDFSLDSRRIIFRMTSSYRESLVSKAVCEYMLDVACSTVDDYNDKFFLYSKKRMDLEELMKSIY